MGTMLTALLNTIILLVFASVVTITTVRSIRQSLIHPLVLTNAILVYYVLAPAGYLLGTRDFLPWLGEGIKALAPALGVLLVMYVLVLIVFYLSRSALERPIASGEIVSIKARPHPKTLFTVGLIGFTFGLAAYLYYVFVNGGFVRMFTVQARLGFQTTPNTGRYRILALAGIMGGFVTTWIALRPALENRRIGDNRGTFALMAVVSAVTLFAMVSTRSRMLIIIPFLFAFIYIFTLGRIPTHYVIGIGVTVFGAVISFSVIEAIVTGTNATLLSGLIHTPRLENFLAIVVRVPNEYPFQWGRTFLRLPIGDWSSRGSVLYGNQVELITIGRPWENHSSSAMWPGELWLNFGLVGVLIGGALYGGALAVVDTIREQLTTPTNGLRYSFVPTGKAFKRGFYPSVLLSVVLILPTNISFVIQSIWLRLLVPPVLAYFAAYLLEDFIVPMLTDQSKSENRL